MGKNLPDKETFELPIKESCNSSDFTGHKASDSKTQFQTQIFFHILFWGFLWGIFESTAGYLLHLLPFSVGWLVWYPVACFFMFNVYKRTQKISRVLAVAVLAASMKMVNLFLPGSIDRVINPAISIIFEALSMMGVLWVIKYHLGENLKKPLTKALALFSMNTGWRILYIMYLLFLVPDWIRDVSVISSADKFIVFFAVHNLFTTIALFAGSLLLAYISKPFNIIEHKVSLIFSMVPVRFIPAAKAILFSFLLCITLALELML